MPKRCCWCGEPILTRCTYYSGEHDEACSAAHAVLKSLKSIKKPGMFDQKFYHELVKGKPPSSPEAKSHTE